MLYYPKGSLALMIDRIVLAENVPFLDHGLPQSIPLFTKMLATPGCIGFGTVWLWFGRPWHSPIGMVRVGIVGLGYSHLYATHVYAHPGCFCFCLRYWVTVGVMADALGLGVFTEVVAARCSTHMMGDGLDRRMKRRRIGAPAARPCFRRHGDVNDGQVGGRRVL